MKDLKNHYFDLADAIKDVSLIAQSTRDNIESTKKKLFLRQKYSKMKRLTPVADGKLWVLQ